MAYGASDGFRGNQYVKVVNGQNDQLPNRREIKDGTAGRIGKEYGVNGRTIRRDAEFAKEIFNE